MTYPAYEKYKESGVPWLGQVPDGWDVVKSRRFSFCEKGKATKPENSTENGLPLLAMEYLRGDGEPELVEPTLKDIIPNEGDILLLWDGSNAGEFLRSKSGVLSATIAKVFISKDLYKDYIYYALKSSEKELKMANIGMGIPHVNGTALKELHYLIPSFLEQRTIAEFLDKKTAEIDALVAKKEELLNLLTEQRTALITHAVTKGLNPSAPMKDSGIDWLGHIPQHWEAIRLRFLLSDPLKYGANESAEFEDRSDPRYIRITDVKEDGSLKEETFKSLPEEVAQPYILDDGDILLARSGATVGKTFIYRPSWGRAAYAGYLIRARISKKANADFIYRFLNSKAYWDWLNSIFIQATIQNVSAEKYASLWIPVPPLEEQQQILDYVDGKLKHMDAVVEKTQQAIDRLKEYRTALITNAVTGKIDVRGYQSKNKEKAA